MSYIRVVLKRMRKYKLYIKLLKYKFNIKKVSFLKFYIEVVGVLIDLSRV